VEIVITSAWCRCTVYTMEMCLSVTFLCPDYKPGTRGFLMLQFCCHFLVEPSSHINFYPAFSEPLFWYSGVSALSAHWVRDGKIQFCWWTDAGVSLSSCRRSRATLECRYSVSRVSASMRPGPTRWSRCFATSRTLTLDYSWLLSFFLAKLPSTVSGSFLLWVTTVYILHCTVCWSKVGYCPQ